MADRKILGSTGKIRFDVTQEHRIAGNGATYIVENYRKSIEHPEFQQAIEMGNAIGYHGHPRRKVTKDGKVIFEPILFPHEEEAVPTHMCVHASMDGKYCTHEEVFFDFGKSPNVPWAMWQARSGGFSSRASTIDGYGGRYRPTKLARMAGFDYVHDRSYRYNGPEGVIASESVKPPELEYLIEELGIGRKAAHFICNGGVCPNPEDLALEEAQFIERLEYELALEEAYRKEFSEAEDRYKIAIESAYRKGFEENLENEKAAFKDEIKKFQEEFQVNRQKELDKAQLIAIECVNRMPRKPYLTKNFWEALAPALIKNGTDEVAIENALYEIIAPFAGYNPADFSETKDEFVKVDPKGKAAQQRYWRPGDRYLILPPKN